MSGARAELSVSPSELDRITEVHALLAQGPAGAPALLAMRVDPSWAVRREIIAALGALGDAAAPALADSLARERGDETRIAATVDALVASTADVDRLLVPLLHGSSVAVLSDIAQILGRRRNSASVPLLATLAQHGDDNVAVAAIEGLGRIGGRAVVDLLVEAVQSTRFFRTFSAIDVLGRSGDPRAVPELAALLGSIHYGFEAARALGRTQDRAAVAPLARLLSSPADANVRVAALALAELHESHRQRFATAAPIEASLVAAAADPAPRRLAQCFGGADAAEQAAICTLLGALRSDRAMPTLMRALDGPPAVAAAAAAALMALGGESDQQLLAALREGNSARRVALLPFIMKASGATEVVACLGDPEPEVRRAACEALGRIGYSGAVPELFTILGDANPGVVQAAIAAIQSLGSAQTVSLASAAALAPAAGVRRAALRILSYLGHAPALAVFVAATRDADARVRDVAIGGLSLLDTAGAQEALLALSNDASAQTRASAMRALGHSKAGERAQARLGAALADADAWVRYYACQSLGRLKVEQFVHAIATLIDDPAGHVRVAAIEALSHLQHELAFTALKRAAESPEADVRHVALLGLGLSRRMESLPMLAALAGSGDAATRLVALSALVNFDGPEALQATVAAVEDTDDNVSAAAIEFLGARKGATATQKLAELLKRPGLNARAQAALSTPGEHRVAGLLSALPSADDETAARITSILVRLHQPHATAALFEALTLPSSAARKAAATTLGALGSREAYAALQRLALEDPDPELRRVCSLLLGQ